MYAFEQADNQVSLDNGGPAARRHVPTEMDPNLAGGVVKVTTEGLVRKPSDWAHQLYQPSDTSAPTRGPAHGRARTRSGAIAASAR